jgi:hypothetical protein
VLLKDILEAQSSKSTSSNTSNNTNGKMSRISNTKRRKKKNGSDDGTGTMIQMNMQELYKLESSYTIDSADFQWDGPGHEGKEISSPLREQEAKEEVVTHRTEKKVSPATPEKVSPATPVAKAKKTDPSPTASQTTTNKNANAKTTTNESPKKKVNPFAKREASPRTSTMPGFGDRRSSQRHQSFRDGLDIAKRSNHQMASKIHKVLHTEKEIKKRRKDNSIAMYEGSASVPDSLIAFAQEIHMVSCNKDDLLCI